jgi:hypothetical protein
MLVMQIGSLEGLQIDRGTVPMNRQLNRLPEVMLGRHRRGMQQPHGFAVCLNAGFMQSYQLIVDIPGPSIQLKTVVG